MSKTEARQAFKEIFGKIDNVEIPFPKIKMDDGKKAQLTHGLYSVCLHHPDRDLRKRAFDALYRTYRDFIKNCWVSSSSSNI